MQIKGYCKDCFYLNRMPVVAENPDGTETIMIDRFCGMSEMFKRELGYCDHFKPKDW